MTTLLFLVLVIIPICLVVGSGIFLFWAWRLQRVQNKGKDSMVVIVTSKTLHVTQALRDMAERQAQKLHRFGKNIIRVRVSLEAVAKKKNDTHATIVQYHVELPGRDVVVKRKARDMYEALVDAASSASRQVRKVKEKELTFKRGYRSMFDEVRVAELPVKSS